MIIWPDTGRRWMGWTRAPRPHRILKALPLLGVCARATLMAPLTCQWPCKLAHQGHTPNQSDKKIDLYSLYVSSCRHTMHFLAMLESVVGSLSYMHKCGFTKKDKFQNSVSLSRMSSADELKQHSQTLKVRAEMSQALFSEVPGNSWNRKNKLCNWHSISGTMFYWSTSKEEAHTKDKSH